MKTRILKATFQDGATITRRTHREYTHAWRAEYKLDPTGRPDHLKEYAGKWRTQHGWALSEENAYKRMRSWQNQMGATDEFRYTISVSVEVVKG